MLVQNIGMEFREISNLICRYVANQNMGHCRLLDDNITFANGWIIAFLAAQQGTDVYQGELEKVFGVTRSTVSKVVHLMERKGLIERQSVAHDARLKRLALTPRAWSMAEQMREDAHAVEAQLSKGFTEEELAALNDYFRRIKMNLTEMVQNQS